MHGTRTSIVRSLHGVATNLLRMAAPTVAPEEAFVKREAELGSGRVQYPKQLNAHVIYVLAVADWSG